jgi:hypothetical protein
MIRSLFAFIRLLPTYQIFRLTRDLAPSDPKMMLEAVIYNPVAQRGGKSSEMAIFDESPDSYAFPAIPTSTKREGHFQLSVFYRRNCTFPFMKSLHAKPLVSISSTLDSALSTSACPEGEGFGGSRILPDYMSSAAVSTSLPSNSQGHTLPQLPLSLPGELIQMPFVRSSKDSSSTAKASSLDIAKETVSTSNSTVQKSSALSLALLSRQSSGSGSSPSNTAPSSPAKQATFAFATPTTTSKYSKPIQCSSLCTYYSSSV